MNKYNFYNDISDQLKEHDYLFQINANVIIESAIGREIFPNRKQKLMFTHHPGYFDYPKEFHPYDRGNSFASIKAEEGRFYLAGGFVGGRSGDFLKMAKDIANWSKIDMSKNRIPSWHDESYVNRYFIDLEKKGIAPLVLKPNYLMPAEALPYDDLYSNLNHLKNDVKILLKNKGEYGGHEYLREAP